MIFKEDLSLAGACDKPLHLQVLSLFYADLKSGKSPSLNRMKNLFNSCLMKA